MGLNQPENGYSVAENKGIQKPGKVFYISDMTRWIFVAVFLALLAPVTAPG